MLGLEIKHDPMSEIEPDPKIEYEINLSHSLRSSLRISPSHRTKLESQPESTTKMNPCLSYQVEPLI